MRSSILIADSGSTKTDWLLHIEGGEDVRVSTQGINPYYLSQQQMREILSDELWPQLQEKTENVGAVCFYGAGCRKDVAHLLEEVLRDFLSAPYVEVHSDMLAVARATCRDEAGIACILGTGSNSCLYDGVSIVRQTPALGFILGDEGSGAVLGKRLVGDVLKHQIPDTLSENFLAEYQLDMNSLLNKVYKQPLPNRYLASFTRFLSKYHDEAYVQNLLREEFSRFIHRNLLQYDAMDLPVHFVGSIAYVFSQDLVAALEQNGMKAGSIHRSPLDGLVAYHLSKSGS
ncbi:MAG: ATPase [Bacteroidaceae bacterium]|nr:ATPase [Bacteroidaceae bacterium]